METRMFDWGMMVILLIALIALALETAPNR
jgi:hypothetical protein